MAVWIEENKEPFCTNGSVNRVNGGKNLLALMGVWIEEKTSSH